MVPPAVKRLEHPIKFAGRYTRAFVLNLDEQHAAAGRRL